MSGQERVARLAAHFTAADPAPGAAQASPTAWVAAPDTARAGADMLRAAGEEHRSRRLPPPPLPAHSAPSLARSLSAFFLQVEAQPTSGSSGTGFNVALLGAAGGIGQPLALLLKL